MAKHPLVPMIEPFEPARINRRRGVSYTVKLDEVTGHVFLRDYKGDSAPGEPVQRLMPSVIRRNVNDIGCLRRVKIVSLDPHCSCRSRLVRATRNNLADGCGHLMLCKQLDHAMPISVADRIGGVDDDRPCFLRVAETIKGCATFTHREYVGATDVK